MRINFQAEHPEGQIIACNNHLRVFDETNKEIKNCIWADDVTGECCILCADNDGNIERQWGNPKYRHMPLELWLTEENKKYGGIIPKTKIIKGRIELK